MVIPRGDKSNDYRWRKFKKYKYSGDIDRHELSRKSINSDKYLGKNYHNNSTNYFKDENDDEERRDFLECNYDSYKSKNGELQSGDDDHQNKKKVISSVEARNNETILSEKNKSECEKCSEENKKLAKYRCRERVPNYNELINENKFTWPAGLSLHDAKSFILKKRLCLVAYRIPSNWRSSDIKWFFRELSYKKVFRKKIRGICLIESIHYNKKENAVIIVCHDELTLNVLIALSPIYLEGLDEKNAENLSDNPRSLNSNSTSLSSANECIKKKRCNSIKILPYYHNKRRKFINSEECRRHWLSYDNDIGCIQKIHFSYEDKFCETWPDDLEVGINVPRKLKKNLLIIVLYKPVFWDSDTLLNYIKEYCAALGKDEKNFRLPHISKVFAEVGKEVAIIACKDKCSANGLLRTNVLYLPSNIEKLNILNNAHPWIVFNKFNHSCEEIFMNSELYIKKKVEPDNTDTISKNQTPSRTELIPS